MRCTRQLLGFGAMILAVALAAPPPASAAITCSYDAGTLGGTLFVQIGAHEDEVRLTTFDVAIGVVDRRTTAIVNCDDGDGAPTTANTEVVIVNDNTNDPLTASPGDGDVTVEISPMERLAPGKTGSGENGGASEIEVTINYGGGDEDRFLSLGTANPDTWHVGSAGAHGIDWNPAGDSAPDRDITLSPAPDTIDFLGQGGGDFISGQGGPGAGAPYVGASSSIHIAGGADNDTLEGGDSNGGFGSGDRLAGQAGNDIHRGFAMNDRFFAGADPGDDTFDGGAGAFDLVDYSGSTTPVSVDLARGGPQPTGQGADTLSAIESAAGGSSSDTVLGGSDANLLAGQAGNDTLAGRGGGDDLVGGDGVDTATYAEAPAGVVVDLSTTPSGTATGGDGDDSISDFENIIGSPFADNLTGSAAANEITGRSGSDSIRALGGADTVDVRDGEADFASCGTELDSAIGDEQILDVIDPDCETISFLPPAAQDGGGGGGVGNADTELTFDLSGKGKQRVVKQKGVVVNASCPLEACTATASGKGKVPKPKRRALAKLNLKPVTEAIAAGVVEQIRLRLKKKQLKAVKAALADGRKPKVTVSASVTDAAGNAATDTLVVKARR